MEETFELGAVEIPERRTKFNRFSPRITYVTSAQPMADNQLVRHVDIPEQPEINYFSNCQASGCCSTYGASSFAP